MGAGARMLQEGAYTLRRLGGEDVLELAGLLLDFALAIHRQTVGEQAFGEPMSANDPGRLLPPLGREFYDHRAVSHRG